MLELLLSEATVDERVSGNKDFNVRYHLKNGRPPLLSLPHTSERKREAGEVAAAGCGWRTT